MRHGVNHQVGLEPIPSLRRAPSSPEKSIDVRSQHRARVIEAENRIKTEPLELPLSGDRTPPPENRFMPGRREESSNITGIVRIRIGTNDGFGKNEFFHFFKQLRPTDGTLIGSRTVLLDRECGDPSLRRHPRDFKPQDSTRFELHHERDRQRLTLRMLEGFQVVELDFPRARSGPVPLLECERFATRQEEELADDRFPVQAEHSSDLSL